MIQMENKDGMNKVVPAIITFIVCFVGMVITNIGWWILLITLGNDMPLELQIPFNVWSAVFCIKAYMYAYIMFYKKLFRGKVSPDLYIGICISPYYVLLQLTAYWLATFPFL